MDSIHFVHSWTKEKFERVKVLTPEQVNSTIEDYLWVIKFLPYALGAAGLFVSFNAIRSTSKFSHASQIPGAFVRKNAQLRGRLAEVNLDGTLSIEHSPIFNLPWHHLKKTQYLDVRLAYTRPNISGIYWLKLNTINRPIKFQIIDRRENELFVSLFLSEKPKTNLNEELIVRGLATLQPEKDIFSRTQRKTFHKLEKLQIKAQNSGAGIWESNYKPSTYRILIKALSDKLKNVITRK